MTEPAPPLGAVAKRAKPYVTGRLVVTAHEPALDDGGRMDSWSNDSRSSSTAPAATSSTTQTPPRSPDAALGTPTPAEPVGHGSTSFEPTSWPTPSEPQQPSDCSFSWQIRNHPVHAECNDQWCSTHRAWKREEPPREFCEAVTLAGVAETVERLTSGYATGCERPCDRADCLEHGYDR